MVDNSVLYKVHWTPVKYNWVIQLYYYLNTEYSTLNPSTPVQLVYNIVLLIEFRVLYTEIILYYVLNTEYSSLNPCTVQLVYNIVLLVENREQYTESLYSQTKTKVRFLRKQYWEWFVILENERMFIILSRMSDLVFPVAIFSLSIIYRSIYLYLSLKRSQVRFRNKNHASGSRINRGQIATPILKIRFRRILG